MEDRLTWDAAFNKSFDQLRPEDITSHHLAITTLSQGKMGTCDKVACVLKSRWTEYGPTAENMKEANRWAIHGLSDMGVELSIGDFADVTTNVLNDQPFTADQCVSEEPDFSRIGAAWVP